LIDFHYTESLIPTFEPIDFDMLVHIINKSKHELPRYETIGSSGMDVRANLDAPVEIAPLGRALVKTGLYLEMTPGMECQVRPRSGLALKKGITVLNSPGTIDADYRGEVGVVLVNLSNEIFSVEDGERIAQLVFCKIEQIELKEVNELSNSDRGAGGFGSTGIN
jgi:dUTP pyrophosphatase